MIRTLESESPWEASWPSVQSSAHLTALMVQAARADCPLICCFLYQSGAQSFFCSQSTTMPQHQSGARPKSKISNRETATTPLHAALDAQHWKLAEQILRNMAGCLYIPDAEARLPMDMIRQDLLQELEMVNFDVLLLTAFSSLYISKLGNYSVSNCRLMHRIPLQVE